MEEEIIEAILKGEGQVIRYHPRIPVYVYMCSNCDYAVPTRFDGSTCIGCDKFLCKICAENDLFWILKFPFDDNNCYYMKNPACSETCAMKYVAKAEELKSLECVQIVQVKDDSINVTYREIDNFELNKEEFAKDWFWNEREDD
jgi:hypothetical protein